MFLTQKIRVFPTKPQQNILWILTEKCRLLYNFALQERIQNWKMQQNKPKKHRQYLTYQEQSKMLPLIKRQYPEYQWVYSKVLQQVLKKLNENFRSFFSKVKRGDKLAHPPRFKGKNNFFTLCYNQSGFKVNSNWVTLSHKHPSKIKLTFKLYYPYQGTQEIKQVEVKHYSNGMWFLCVTYKYTPPLYKDNGLYQAIDLGISNVVSAVNLHLKFTQITNRRADLYWKKKLEEVQSKRDHCKQFSHRWQRYNEKLKSMKRKCTNQLRDYQHKISKKITMNTKANTIIIGDLHVKKMAKRKKGMGNAAKTKRNKTLNHSIHNTGSMGRFTEFLTYKAEKIGKRVIRIDESYTFQKCYICGRKKKRALSERTILCDCGNQIDRDLNSAINILERFIRKKKEYGFLLQQPSMTEESFLKRLDLLRHTAPSSLLAGDGGLVVS